MKTKLIVAVGMLFFCSLARADSIETLAVPEGSQVVALYSGYGITQWDPQYLFPQLIDKDGLWEATEIVFIMPVNGTFSLDVQTGQDQLTADIFGQGVGELWSFDTAAVPGIPIDFNIRDSEFGGSVVPFLVSLAIVNSPAVSVAEPSGFYLLMVGFLVFAFLGSRAWTRKNNPLNAA
jgi:hypothetical protein